MSERVEYVVVGLGALGSAAAYELAARGADVVGLERFELGHHRGASHDSSRILRHSYHTPGYVRLTFDAYDDWARLETESGEHLVTTVGGLDLFPPGCAIPPEDYVSSMTLSGVDFETLALLDDLITYLRAALPQMRSDSSTLGREATLAVAYAKVLPRRTPRRPRCEFRCA